MLAEGSLATFELLCGLELDAPLWHVRAMEQRRLSPETLVLIELPEGESQEDHVRRIRQSAARTTTITIGRAIEQDLALRYLYAGAFGAVDVTTQRDTLQRALMGALRGEPVFSREVLGRWMRETRGASLRPEDGQLTARQREIVALVARGATDKEIAVALGIGIATAQKHVANTLKRLGAKNRAAAVGIIFRQRMDPQFTD